MTLEKLASKWRAQNHGEGIEHISDSAIADLILLVAKEMNTPEGITGLNAHDGPFIVTEVGTPILHVNAKHVG